MGRLFLTPNPYHVLIRISKKAWEELFFKKIKNKNGEYIKLWTEIEASEGYERRFQQNTSVGEVMAIGKFVKNVERGDIAILDYLAANSKDCLIGYDNEDQIISVRAETTYYSQNAPMYKGKRAYKKGEIDHLSKLLGVVRNKKLISFKPYIFLESQSVLQVHADGSINAAKLQDLITREAVACPDGSLYRTGHRLVFKEGDRQIRSISGEEISVVHEEDILYSKK